MGTHIGVLPFAPLRHGSSGLGPGRFAGLRACRPASRKARSRCRLRSRSPILAPSSNSTSRSISLSGRFIPFSAEPNSERRGILGRRQSLSSALWSENSPVAISHLNSMLTGARLEEVSARIAAGVASAAVLHRQLQPLRLAASPRNYQRWLGRRFPGNRREGGKTIRLRPDAPAQNPDPPQTGPTESIEVRPRQIDEITGLRASARPVSLPELPARSCHSVRDRAAALVVQSRSCPRLPFGRSA